MTRGLVASVTQLRENGERLGQRLKTRSCMSVSGIVLGGAADRRGRQDVD